MRAFGRSPGISRAYAVKLSCGCGTICRGCVRSKRLSRQDIRLPHRFDQFMNLINQKCLCEKLFTLKFRRVGYCTEFDLPVRILPTAARLKVFEFREAHGAGAL